MTKKKVTVVIETSIGDKCCSSKCQFGTYDNPKCLLFNVNRRENINPTKNYHWTRCVLCHDMAIPIEDWEE